ncbi:50S ribosomal protein L21, mitochondrial-like [Xenia sp. Carnegie-2017]|uniref:50S ribosomal protein L21, mitochondrial-like n=1 Tax=Xenia sp. Carnegie-2017 TaxID=2897299 RepID=UPI001F045D43|nr:50S ribosomal protein L21, mitochondrial-like [Xenia sp. Carnegie-2017]
MAARATRSVFHVGKKSLHHVMLRRVSVENNIRYSLRLLQRASISSFNGNPTVPNLLQTLSKRGSPAFVGHIKRLQNLAVNIDTALCDVSTNQENTQQDISLLEQCAEDDDDQFRKKENDVLIKVKEEAKSAQRSGNIFAIVHIGGSQFKVSLNDTIMVNKLPVEIGTRIKIEKVLVLGSENFTIVGCPLVQNGSSEVQATIVEHIKDRKIIVFKKKKRKGYKRTQGHRQALSILKIDKISLNVDAF